MSTHTPGPWEARSRGLSDNTLIVSGPGGELAVIRNRADRTFDNNDRDVANARLIAAAPDLLAALRAIIRDVDDGWVPRPRREAEIRALVAKAEEGS